MTPTTRARLADDLLAMLLLGGLGCLLVFALFSPDTAPVTGPDSYEEAP